MQMTPSPRLWTLGFTSLPVFLVLLLSATPAYADEEYFNGVQVTGLKNQSFDHCKVKFDAGGNVHITAKGYKVKRVEQGRTTTSSTSAKPRRSTKPGSVTKKYFLYARSSRQGYAQYDIDIYINGKWARKIRNTESQVVTEITSKLRPGSNVIHFAATKNFRGKSRLSTAASDYTEVIVGTGNRGGGTVNITNSLTSFKATASTTGNFGREQTIEVN